MSKIIATASDGDALVARVITSPGCLARLGASVRRWPTMGGFAVTWLFVVGAAFACGYGCKAAGG